MISRIRIDAFGRTAQDCDDALNRYAAWINEQFGIPCSLGERVLEHQLEEPEGSDFFYKGRISIHFELLTRDGPASHTPLTPPIENNITFQHFLYPEEREAVSNG